MVWDSTRESRHSAQKKRGVLFYAARCARNPGLEWPVERELEMDQTIIATWRCNLKNPDMFPTKMKMWDGTLRFVRTIPKKRISIYEANKKKFSDGFLHKLGAMNFRKSLGQIITVIIGRLNQFNMPILTFKFYLDLIYIYPYIHPSNTYCATLASALEVGASPFRITGDGSQGRSSRQWTYNMENPWKTPMVSEHPQIMGVFLYFLVPLSMLIYVDLGPLRLNLLDSKPPIVGRIRGVNCSDPYLFPYRNNVAFETLYHPWWL